MTLIADLCNVTQMQLLQTFQMMALKGGMLIFLRDSDGKICLIILFFWPNSCLRRTPRSTLEAKTLAPVKGTEVSVYLETLLTQITEHKYINMRCFGGQQEFI